VSGGVKLAYDCGDASGGATRARPPSCASMPRRERKFERESAVVVLLLGLSPVPPQCLPPSSVPMSTIAIRRLSAPPSDGMLGRRVTSFKPGGNTVRG